MSQQKLLIEVASVLERLNFGYFITGSIASTIHGEPRSTHDIDLVISVNTSQVKDFVDAFKDSDYYLDIDAALDSVLNSSMFNLIDVNSGDKIDFWILTNDLFDQSRYKRRVKKKVFDKELYISTPEDTILMKLKWAKMSGGSQKQIDDCIGIYEMNKSSLDIDYIKKWASILKISKQLEQLI
jgi:hypothetical protein